MKLGISLGALAALQLLAGFATQLVVLATLGVGAGTDNWVAAQTVPMIVFSIASVAFQGAWQSQLAVEAGNASAWQAAQQRAHGQLLLVALPVLALLGATAELWARQVFPGFSTQQVASTSDMTRVLLVATWMNCHGALLTTALRSREQFVQGELVSAGGAVLMLAFMPWVVRGHGVEGAALLMLLRAAVVTLCLFRLAGMPWPALTAAWRDKRQWSQLRPLLFGSSLYKTGPIVDRYWTSLAPAGGMTAFNFVQMGMGALASVLERALCMPAHPRLARLAAQGDLDGMRALYRQRIRWVLLLALGIAMLLLLLQPVWPTLAAPLLKLPDAGLMQTWWMCVLLLAYLVPAACGSVVVSSFYALGDTRTPVRIGTLGFVLSIALKSAGFLYAGLLGMAAAISAHYVLNMLAMWALLERRLRSGVACQPKLPDGSIE